MAATVVDVLNVKKVNFTSDAGALQTGTVADGFEIPIDGKTINVILTGTAAGTVTFKQGNGIQGVKDLTVAVPKDKVVAIRLDTGYFENVSGDDKGKILAIPSAATISVIAIAD